MIAVLLISGATMAQGSKGKVTKSFLAFHAGPSFPVGDFGITKLSASNGVVADRDAGFAKTGYNLDLAYGYKVNGNFGFTASAFFNNNKLNNGAIQREMEKELDVATGELNGLKLDHWKWYGIAAGPMLSHNITPKVAVDLRVMGGVANANSPKIVFADWVTIKEDWSAAPLFLGALDLRFGLSNNMFIFTNVDYLYMKPEFKVETNIDGEIMTETFKQKMSVVNLTGGVGIRF